MATASAPDQSSAPPSGVTIIDTPPPPPPPAPTSSIKVSQMPATAEPITTPKSSAMSRLRADLQKKAKPSGEPAQPADPPATKPAAAKTAEQPKSTETPPAEATPGEDPASTSPEAGSTPPAAPEAAKPGKTNPWKLVDTYKAKIAEMEKQIAEAKTSPISEQAKKEYLDKIAAIEKQNKELSDEIRFVNFTKHPEFIEKYQKPYEEAWKRAVSELSELQLVDPNTNQPRTASADDLLALVNLPLGKAREVANQTFGEFADDVMLHRKEIRNLFEAQQQALENERKAGAERDKLRSEQFEKQRSDTQNLIRQTWDKENEAVRNHEKYGKFFSPVEGDEEGNSRLQKGFELVDKAFAANPVDPSLSPEQRVQAVRLHAAVRNRAAAFGRLTGTISKLESENAALKAELEQFKNSTPPTGGQGSTTPPTTAPASARDLVFSALRARAK